MIGIVTLGCSLVAAPPISAQAPGVLEAIAPPDASTSPADPPRAAGRAMVSTVRRDDQSDPLQRLRHLYYAAVEDDAAIPAAAAEIEMLRAARVDCVSSPSAAVLDAYSGALTTLRAKHGWWPPDRLGHLNRGFELLDAAVAADPGDVEIRYLRLMSAYYLPGLLGRGWSVREDFEALFHLLPQAASAFPRDIYRPIVRFVLEKGSPPAEPRRALEEALRDAGR